MSILRERKLRMKYSGQGGSGPRGGQVMGSEIKMVQACKEAPMRRCERLAMVSLRRARGRLKKYLGEVIR